MMPEAISTDVIEESGVPVPMRDGVVLSAHVWRPRGAAAVPVLLSRTPYALDLAVQSLQPARLAAAGFAVVIQHCRGRFDSEGEWIYVHSEVDDGYDTVEWAAAQPWSNGRVGMFGQSYGGSTQWLAAQTHPPHLEVIAPEACAGDYWEGTFDSGGTFRLALRIGWTALVISEMAETWGVEDPLLHRLRDLTAEIQTAARAGEMERLRDAQAQTREVMDAILRTRPFRDNPLWQGRDTWLDEAFSHERSDDSWWRRINPTSHVSGIDLPALHIASWYDIHLGAMLRVYQGMRREAPSERAQQAQHLVIGPWDHWHPGQQLVGEVDFTAEAAIDITELRARWFARWLRDEPVAEQPRVRLFVMGEDVWRDEQEWPLARTQYTPWYFHDGGLLDARLPQQPGIDEYVYDPRDPVPTLGGRLLGGGGELAGPRDQRPLDERSDIICYTSEPLTQDLELTGPVRVELWASTDAPDTDFTAMLVDIRPDGRVLNLCEGAVRARHVIPVSPLVPGAAYHYTLDLAATSCLLRRGHRVGIRVSSSSFPEWEPNPNTGNPVGVDTDEDLRVARQGIRTGGIHPSRVILPIIPR